MFSNLTSLSEYLQPRTAYEYVYSQVLCLNHNHIDCIMSRPRQHNTMLNRGRVAGSPIDVIPTDSCAQLLEKLEVLHLGWVTPAGYCQVKPQSYQFVKVSSYTTYSTKSRQSSLERHECFYSTENIQYCNIMIPSPFKSYVMGFVLKMLHPHRLVTLITLDQAPL